MISNKKIDLPVQGIKIYPLSVGMRGKHSGCVNERARLRAELWRLLVGEWRHTLDHFFKRVGFG